MTYKDIARLVPTIQAASLVGHNMKIASKKKIDTKDMMNMGMTNVIGISMLKINADLIEGL